MKKLLLLVVICIYSISLQAQSCDEEYLSLEGLSHYRKAMEYSKNLQLGTHDKALSEWEAVLQTDSLWCDDVYRRAGFLCEYIYANKKPKGERIYLEKAIRYYKLFLAFDQNKNNREVSASLSKLEAELDVYKNSINDSIKIEMVYVEGMLNADKTHCIHSFYIGKYEVTQAQWEAVMGSNPSYFKGPNLPVENISKHDAELFIKELNRITGNNYRLPTEEEWQYAAHGGKNQENYTYSGGFAPDKLGWTENNSNGRTHPVGEKEPNSLGIYDMTGNVSEMCSDRHSNPSYNKGPDYFYNCYGGDWYSYPRNLDYGEEIHINNHYMGIRLVLTDQDMIRKEDSIIRIKRHEEDSIRNEQAYKESFFPVIAFSKKIGIDISVGYKIKKEIPVLNASVLLGPIYASALLLDNDSLFSAGVSLQIINRFSILLGASCILENNLFGADMGLRKDWGNFSLSGGAMFFPNTPTWKIIPHIEASGFGFTLGSYYYDNQFIPSFGCRFSKSNWVWNISSVYGYDFTNKSHVMGLSGFVGPVYVSAMYQTDNTLHFSLGGTQTLFGSRVIGLHGAVAYSTADKLGLDAGLTISFAGNNVKYGNISFGVLAYKDKIIPTIGVGGLGGLIALLVSGSVVGIIYGANDLFNGI